MLVSILHRVTGGALTVAGPCGAHLVAAGVIAGGGDAYAEFTKLATHPFGLVVLIGLTWAFFQHLLSGIRHLVMDTGADFELGIQQELRDPDDRRVDGPDRGALVLYSGRREMSLGDSATAARQGSRPRLGARRRRALA